MSIDSLFFELDELADVGERTGVDFAGWNPSSRLLTVAADPNEGAAGGGGGGGDIAACSAGLLIDAFAKTLFAGGGEDASDADDVDLLDALPLDVERCLCPCPCPCLSRPLFVCWVWVCTWSARGDVAL